MAKKTKAKAAKARPRRERRFDPRPTAQPGLVYALGAGGALLMGGGAWEQFGSLLSDGAPDPLKAAPYILAAGAVLAGIAIWVGTSGDASLRVGDAGLAIDKGGLKRMPWYAIERIEWRDETVRVTGKDELGVPLSIQAPASTQAQAAAWIVKEARARVPAVVDVPEDAALPEASVEGRDAGVSLPLEPPQVVGKHCAESGKVISYEPDARVCPRCERVYHKAHVPPTCACGASLADLRAPAT
ncbi:MAG TPA: hypothetical protein VHV30_08880 [Polyangiaceae bacterium]|jgi:hypothetical protein|nr:hypothetical protein [Polyangiaceae bacterium]